MYKNIFLSFQLFFFLGIQNFINAQTPTTADYNLVLQRMEADILKSTPLSDAETAKILGFVQPQNTSLGDITKPYFSDIDYTADFNQKFNKITYRVRLHTDRIRDLAIVYTNGSAKYKGKQEVLDAIIGALDYFRINQVELEDWKLRANYTYRFIDFPRSYTVALVLLRNNSMMLPNLSAYFGMVVDYTQVNIDPTKPLVEAYTGANLIENAKNIFRKGLVLKNPVLANNALGAIASFLNKNSEDDGVLIDQSFYAHHQIYNSGYGFGFENALILYCDNFIKGTNFRSNFSIPKMANYILHGQRWFEYYRAYDFHTKGRNYIRVGAEHFLGDKDSSPYLVEPFALDYMAVADKSRANLYLSYKSHIVNGTAPTLVGHKQFFKGNMNVHRGTDYYMSVKFPSSRVFSNERGNLQGLKSYNMCLGGTLIMADGNEFMRPDRIIPASKSTYLEGEMIPIMNYSLFPGTTTKYSAIGDVPLIGPNVDNKDFYHMKGANTFGGGLNTGESSDDFVGNSGMAAFVQDKMGIYDNGGTSAGFKILYTDQLVKANKAYFFIGDAMLCMGSGITSTNDSIATTINQHLTAGRVTFNDGTKKIFTNSQQTFSNLKWVHHDQIGYVFPQNAKVVMKNNIQTGFFISDHLGPANNNDQLARDSVFTLWVQHGNTPTDKPTNEKYQYVVYPNITETALATRYASFANEFSEIINTDTIQAVRSTKNNTYAAVFYKTGTCDFGDGFSIYVDKAALVFIQKNASGYSVSVSDPYYVDNNTIKVRINKLLTGINAIAYTYTTIITTALPNGELTGSAVTYQYNNKIITRFDGSESFAEYPSKCYPNPFSDFMQLKHNGTYKLLDLSGVEVEKGVCNGNCEIGSELNNGLYILETKNSAKTEHIKVLKQ